MEPLVSLVAVVVVVPLDVIVNVLSFSHPGRFCGQQLQKVDTNVSRNCRDMVQYKTKLMLLLSKAIMSNKSPSGQYTSKKKL